MQDDDKIYFNSGDLVQLKQELPNKPIMIVVKKVTSIFKHDKPEDKKNLLKGIKCRWFTKNGELQESIWNTKDLELITRNNKTI